MDNEKYVVAYDEELYNKDEESFNDSMENGKPINWTSFKRLMIQDLCQNNILESNSVGFVRLEDIKFAFEHPRRNYRTLMNASDCLMKISPHYYRLNMFYSNLPVYSWWIDLYDVKENANIATIKKLYDTLSSRIEKINISYEFSKIMKVLPYQDIYCGLVMENSSDFFFQQVDYRICKLKQVQDGLYNFAINLSAINPVNINAYPDYVKQAYADYTQGLINCWYVPPADKQICLKLNTQWTYPYPIMIGLVRDILDLDTYKKLKLQSARTDNYKAIVVKVPIDESTVDKPLLTPETLGVFAEINKESMTDDIGLIHTLGSDGKAISFKDSNNTRNNVSESVGDIYDSSGITKELYNGSSSGTAVTFSVENDSAIVYGVYRQIERWVNRFIKLNKFNKTNFKFMFTLLDSTVFNRDTVTTRYKDACTLGLRLKGQYYASLGMTPSRVKGASILEDSIFDFDNNLSTLESAFNQGTEDSEGGRPTNESKGEQLTNSGEQTKDTEANSKR